jgi:hypothetical protein
MKHIYFIYFLFLVGLQSCEEPCPEKVNRADFIMSSKYNGISEDTFMTGTSVFFRPMYANATSYTWFMPDGQVYKNSPNCIYDVENTYYWYKVRDTTVLIKLLVRYEIDKKCNPQDSGIDSVIKKLCIPHFTKSFAWRGTFRGYNEDNPKHYFNITLPARVFPSDSVIKVCKGSLNNCALDYRIINLPEGCGDVNIYTIFVPEFNFFRYYDFEFRSRIFDKNCKMVSGKGYVKPDRSIVIEYSYKETNNQIVQKKFIGKKIN